MGNDNRKDLNKSATEVQAGAKQPEPLEPLEPLEPCDKPHVAEATRTGESDEACDDGVH